jgi:hypothetical protein
MLLEKGKEIKAESFDRFALFFVLFYKNLYFRSDH